MADFEIKGISKLEMALKRRMNLDPVKDVIKRHSAEMETKMKRKAAVDTGFMRRSIKTNIEDSGFTSRTKPTAEYSSYVEYGTRYNNAQPFVRPAYYEQRNKFIKDMKDLMK